MTEQRRNVLLLAVPLFGVFLFLHLILALAFWREIFGYLFLPSWTGILVGAIVALATKRWRLSLGLLFGEAAFWLTIGFSPIAYRL